jgi:hypothetical protein
MKEKSCFLLEKKKIVFAPFYLFINVSQFSVCRIFFSSFFIYKILDLVEIAENLTFKKIFLEQR